jgi:glutamate synthase (ferredoxin)
MIFLPQDENKAALSRKVIEEVVTKNRLRVLGWRKVPVKPEVLGELARANQPQIEQIIVRSRSSSGVSGLFGMGKLEGDALEKQLYLVKRSISTALAGKGLNWWDDGIYVCSFSSRTIIYKGMVRSVVLDKFYSDLTDPNYKSQFAIYHRRFSTNTMPRWPLAQPFRTLGHNGEINTLLGNINWMRAREAVMDQTAAFPAGAELSSIDPLSDEKYSDSANLDAAVELLIRTGKTPMESLMIMVPEAYRDQPEIANRPEITNFYDYYSGMQEAWDGPALLVFSDGRKVGATLDRNGLRPARYFTTSDGLVCMMSETGVVPDIDDAKIEKKGRLGPGQMIALDLESGEFYENFDIKSKIARQHPFGDWLKRQQVVVKKQPFSGERLWPDEATLVRNQVVFGWSSEDMEMQIADMASTGKETTFCMGDDTPLAVLSEKPHVLFNYFKQRFAQVTNPAIDPLRESIVMSLETHLGAKGNAVEGATEDKAGLIKLESPVLNDGEIQTVQSSGRASKTLSTLYEVSSGPAGLRTAVEALCQQAETAVRAGAEILILSDLNKGGITAEKTYIPPLLAVGAVHHHLLSKKLRLRASLISQTAQCWSTHHVACLIGYGASAVHPYAALESVRSWYYSAKTKSLMEQGKIPSISVGDALDNYRESIDGGLLKIMSKIGISLLSSYHAAQIFEAIGLGKDLITLGFKGTVSRVGGLTVEELANEVNSLHRAGFPETPLKNLQNYGFVKYYTGKEYHHNSPPLTKLLHKALETKDIDSYKLFQESLRTAPLSTLRDLLDVKSDREPIPIDQVQPLEEIVSRFCTGGMSLGALSREAHETLAIAMNRFGGKSNSGEGGEDVLRFSPITDVTAEGTSATFPHLKGLRKGDIASSKIKQVASGRFGVHPEYLMSAEQIEIKLAQGAKPGEGGQLPGAKIDAYIATLRLSKPGVTLISPPPHHDIYSIEDLAQLIYDLHQINPAAKVSVKLVAGAGIGTIAAGVAKANADVIQISGHDGGTGASPLSSIKHAGVPWELGLTEVHRTLVENKLRERVLLRVDGGLKTGWDIVLAALSGGEEYGFGTIAMIAEGCIMARICHTNNCPVGVTTQKEALRKKFPGTPEDVVTYFAFVGEEVRQVLAHMGYSRLQDIIGRGDLLKPRPGAAPAKTIHMDLSFLTDLPDVRTDRSWVHDGRTQGVHSNGPVLDDDLLKDPALADAIASRGAYSRELRIINTDRSVGARVAGVVAKRWGNKGFAAEGGQIRLTFRGSAGQSFGAFGLPGMRMEVIGEVNDYCGKGIHGGEIVVRPPEDVPAGFDASENVIVGNTALYGATGGHLFAAGRAGERFAVRNSACRAVCEGTGDHALEYMTGGVVVVLGPTGRNVAAGMTGGLAYVLEESAGALDARLNKEIVQVQRVRTAAGEQQLRGLIEAHVEATGSEKGRRILAKWNEYLPKFWQIVPPAEAKTPEASDRDLEPASSSAVPVAK